MLFRSDHVYEKDVVDKLVAERRAFIMPLRYETRYPSEFSNVALPDACPPQYLDQGHGLANEYS